MIARVIERRRSNKRRIANQTFLDMLPQIRSSARLAFRSAGPEAKEELVAEVVANAYCAFVRLVEKGHADQAFATPLASFAIRQVCSGRRVGTPRNVRDVSSRYAQQQKGFVLDRLDVFHRQRQEWLEVLIEDKNAGPAETAAARIDVAAWFRTLDRRNRRIARALARGETTSEVAAKFRLSQGRVSQLRQKFKQSWETFQGLAPKA
jgi:hypothetical protein